MGVRESFSTVAARYCFIQQTIQEKALACGRYPKEITLVAVTKTQSFSVIQEVYQAGGRQFGENRVQEALAKIPQFASDCCWHLIGSLQSKKVGKVLPASFQLIHSVDSLELAHKINETAQSHQQIVSILLQVNTSQELSKHGLSAQKWLAILDSLNQCSFLKIEGLMTMAPLTEDEKIIRSCFKQLYQLREKWKSYLKEPALFRHLSMGMSNDYEIAIQEGATIVRIGSAIFGKPLL
jgi:PLP dependent protein